MWKDKAILPEVDLSNDGQGLRSPIVLTKDSKGWVDLARFYYDSLDVLSDIVTVNGYTITSKVVKWTHIPSE